MTSGEVQNKRPISELIQEAFDYCQIGVEEESTDAEDFQRALRAANFMLRNWQSQGIHLWQYTEATLFLQTGRTNYPLQADTVRTVRADLVSNGTTQEVIPPLISSVIILFVPFYDDDGVLHGAVDDDLNDWNVGFCIDSEIVWKTITDWTVFNATQNLYQMVIDVPFDSEIPEGTKMFLYPPATLTKSVVQAERLLSVRRINELASTFSNETPINFVSHDEFFRLPNRKTTGVPNECTFDRLKDGGVFHLWQTPENETTYQIKYTFERTFEKFVNTGDDADFPRYWEDAFIFNLAARIAIKFRVDPQIVAYIQQEAAKTLNEALNYDNANYDISVTINNRVGS